MNRFYPHPIVAREGWRIIGTLAALTLFAYFYATNSPKLALWLLLATLASAHLFRDRVRNIPMDANALLSPADGHVILVENALNSHSNQNALKISIRTPFSVPTPSAAQFAAAWWCKKTVNATSCNCSPTRGKQA